MTAVKSTQWYLQQNSKEVGPITASELLQAVVSGQVIANTLIRQDGRKWVAAKQVEGLLEKAAQLKQARTSTALTELQRKQQKLEQVVNSILLLKKQEQQLRQKRRNRRLLVAAIKGTFLAISWLNKHGDELLADNNIPSSESDSSIDDFLVDELFNDFFDTFSGIDFNNVNVIVESIDLTEITLFDLEATQSELESVLATLC